MKRSLIAVAAVFILWEVLDFILHNQILMSTYEETASLWRPMEEMMSKMWIMHMVVLVSAAVFVYIYVRFFAEKNMGSAIKYGIVYGIATGMGMGYGMYTVMPIPYTLAVGWFWGAVVESTLAGVVLGAIAKDEVDRTETQAGS